MIDPEFRWSQLCVRSGAATSHIVEAWMALAAAYAEPWRHYHTMDHIRALLVLRTEHAALFREPETVDFAIFLHDVVYQPKRSDNEARSADWARVRLPALSVDAPRIEGIVQLIEMSRHDPAALEAIEPQSDVALFLDLDLSILAADGPSYAAYARAVRQEYSIYPDDMYRAGRAKVLQGFLRRRSIYCSAPLRAAWENGARLNLESELRGLGS